jgi:site-specific DNA-cytosine methylase
MNVLVACEESQRVCTAFREKGHNAFSCDILPCSGGRPEWHCQGDVLNILNGSGDKEECFCTQDNKSHKLPVKWDLIIAHPPCTYLTLAGNKWFKPEFADRFPDRQRQRKEAIDFFMAIANADCDKIAIENPVGVMSSQWRKPDQYIEPYMFGDPEKKKTGLWLKGLPLLKPTNIVEPVIIHCKSGANEPRWHMETMHLPKEERSRVRSQTFPGIAKAFADQWG